MRSGRSRPSPTASPRSGSASTSPPSPSPGPSTSEPRFTELASSWCTRRRGEVSERTAEHFEWCLSVHLLAHFGELLPSEITLGTIQAYASEKIADRERRDHAITQWEQASRRTRGRRPSPGLSNSSIEKTIKTLAMVLDDAIDAGRVEANPARGRRRRLKTTRPRRTWLERDEADALLQAAGRDRALLAVMMLGGLRVGEACQLRWRSVDLARGRLTVEAGKTDAASRTLTMSGELADELLDGRARAYRSEPRLGDLREGCDEQGWDRSEHRCCDDRR